MNFYIVDGYNWGYGESSYFCVQAETQIEAENKVSIKINKMSEEDKKQGYVIPCPIYFDDNGVSQNLIHLW